MQARKFFQKTTCKAVIVIVLVFGMFSAPCFSESCFDSSEYKNSIAIAKAANYENAAQLEKAVNFLTATKGLSFDQALGEIMRFSAPETVTYDKMLNEIGKKIKSMKPQSFEECSELIALQRQYEAIGRDKMHFIVSRIIEPPEESTPAVIPPQ
jgi:hypothetical protein